MHKKLVIVCPPEYNKKEIKNKKKYQNDNICHDNNVYL